MTRTGIISFLWEILAFQHSFSSWTGVKWQIYGIGSSEKLWEMFRCFVWGWLDVELCLLGLLQYLLVRCLNGPIALTLGSMMHKGAWARAKRMVLEGRWSPVCKPQWKNCAKLIFCVENFEWSKTAFSIEKTVTENSLTTLAMNNSY